MKRYRNRGNPRKHTICIARDDEGGKGIYELKEICRLKKINPCIHYTRIVVSKSEDDVFVTCTTIITKSISFLLAVAANRLELVRTDSQLQIALFLFDADKR